MALFPQIFILIVIIDFLAIRYIRFSVYIYYILNIRFIYFFFYSFLSNSISSYRCTNFDFKLLVILFWLKLLLLLLSIMLLLESGNRYNLLIGDCMYQIRLVSAFLQIATEMHLIGYEYTALFAFFQLFFYCKSNRSVKIIKLDSKHTGSRRQKPFCSLLIIFSLVVTHVLHLNFSLTFQFSCRCRLVQATEALLLYLPIRTIDVNWRFAQSARS